MPRKIDFEVIKPKKAVVDVKTAGVNAIEVQLPGKQGKDGYSPVRGVDYFTEADKTEMVQAVKESLSSETWTFTLEDGSTVEKKVLLA